MKSQEIKGRNILLLGYGREGKSTHAYLTKLYPKAKISIADKNEVTPLAPVINVYSGPDYLTDLKDFDTVIRSPGISAYTPELLNYVKGGGNLTSATNIFFAACPGRTIGITGTKGKSTTSALIAQILGMKYKDVRLCGNIGNPMLDALFGASNQSIFIVELSSHQLEDAHFSPEFAVVLNIVPEHLDYYKDFSAYQQAKAHIVATQKPTDAVIFNPNHLTSAKIAKKSPGLKYGFSLEAQKGAAAWIDKNKIFCSVSGPVKFIMNTGDILLKGNLENVLAAVTIGSLLKVEPGKVWEAVSTFMPLSHRLEFVGAFKGIVFYNDSLATIPEATMHALDALGENVETLIVGGFDRGLDYKDLGLYLANRKGLKNLILLPDTGKKIWQAVLLASQGGSTYLRDFKVKTLAEAVKVALCQTSTGKICLLSPASASFNMFRDYAERGESFKNLVRSYENNYGGRWS